MTSARDQSSTRPEPIAHSSYQSFLLRLWHVGYTDRREWRASLENITTGELVGFENLTELLTYLETKFYPPDTPTPEEAAT